MLIALRFIVLIFLQIDVDIGSSTVANGVLGLVIGVITTLVVDMAFLIQVFISFYFFKKRKLFLSTVSKIVFYIIYLVLYLNNTLLRLNKYVFSCISAECELYIL